MGEYTFLLPFNPTRFPPECGALLREVQLELRLQFKRSHPHHPHSMKIPNMTGTILNQFKTVASLVVFRTVTLCKLIPVPA